MPKYDFNNSRYAQLFLQSESNTLVNLITKTDLFRRNDSWWRTQFAKDGGKTPTDREGKATFTVRARELKASPMMDMRAPLGDSIPVDNEGLSIYTGAIPDFIAPGIVETATEREYREQIYEAYGNDADIVYEWSKKVLDQYSGANQTLSNLGAQLMTTGKMVYNFGRGINSPIGKAEIPEDNFITAGEKAWSDANCDILAQMVEIETKFRDAWGYDGPCVWQMTRSQFYNQLLKNEKVRDYIMAWRKVNEKVYEHLPIITEEMFREAIVSYPGLSRIELVEERQKNLTWDSVADVHGWKDNIVVFRPAGYAGVIKYTEAIDRKMYEKYGASTITKVFAPVDGGIMSLVNTTLNNGIFKEWHTDFIMSAVPALTEFPQHVIVDTATADS